MGELSKDIEDGVESRSAMVRMFSNYWHSTGKLYSQSVYSTSKVNLSLENSVQNRLSSSLEDLKIEPDFYDSYILDAYIHCLVCGRQSTTERLSKENAQTIMNLRVDQSLQMMISLRSFEKHLRQE